MSLASLAALCPIWGEAKILSAPSASPPKAVFFLIPQSGLCQAAAPTGEQIHRPGLVPSQRESLLAVPFGFGVFFSKKSVPWEIVSACAVPLLGLVLGADHLDMELWNYGITELWN